MKNQNISTIIIVLFILQNIGCYSYSQIPMEDIQEINKDDEVKITILNEKEYQLTKVEIQGDTLRGTDKSVYPNREVEIPVEEITRLEVAGSNSLLYLTVGAIVVGVIVLLNSLSIGS